MNCHSKISQFVFKRYWLRTVYHSSEYQMMVSSSHCHVFPISYHLPIEKTNSNFRSLLLAFCPSPAEAELSAVLAPKMIRAMPTRVLVFPGAFFR